MKLVILLLIALSITIAWQTSVLARQSEASIADTSAHSKTIQMTPTNRQ
ncbi:MAG: hypothetical protein L3J28_14880 [Candidatus Polarisedimenticolaceae bacterium]|nr:hypothetical protein [Candidatus Polarisedimenticolaceae bacterium]